MDFNTYDPTIHDDPYPTYRMLRDEHPAYWNERLRFWVLSRYEDVLAALRDPATFSSAGGITIDARGREFKPMMITMDPPQHTGLRNLVAKAFTPRRVAELEPRIRTIAEALLDSLVGRSGARRPHPRAGGHGARPRRDAGGDGALPLFRRVPRRAPSRTARRSRERAPGRGGRRPRAHRGRAARLLLPAPDRRSRDDGEPPWERAPGTGPTPGCPRRPGAEPRIAADGDRRVPSVRRAGPGPR